MRVCKVAQAGRRGEDVRSDLHVTLEIRDQGGLEIELRSKVGFAYGDAIRAQAAGLLADLGVEHARIEIDDGGALPFVIAARIQCAAQRAGIRSEARPERTVPIPAPSARDRLRRSRLYLPGNEPKFMVNAGLHRPDGIILDLEDSVHVAEKDAAQYVVRNALRCVDFGAAERMVRINPGARGLLDLEYVVPEGPDVILLPKVEEPEQVVEVDRTLALLLARKGVPRRELWLMPILESALGIENAFAIAGASKRIVALTIGLEDFTADLGVVKTRDGDESLYARRRLVNAARAAGVQAIDSVYGDIDDLEGLRAWTERSHAMGFEGMGCVHPRQIPILHAGFAPTAIEIERALKIEAAFRIADANGTSVVSLGSKMIDPPVVERARQLLERARRMGLVGEEQPT